VHEGVRGSRAGLHPLGQAVAACTPVVGVHLDGLRRTAFHDLYLDAPAGERSIFEEGDDRRPIKPIPITGTVSRSPAHGTWAATLPPAFVQRSASSRASEAPPTITFIVVRGRSSDAHSVPQRQHVFSWRAIGALQDRHTRGECRSRMIQRFFLESGITPTLD
jgi:hypothetical protein